MKCMIGIIGTGGVGSQQFLTPDVLQAAEEIGRTLAFAEAIVVSGGTDGVMEAVSKGAHEAGGMTLGFLPGMDKRQANPYIDIAIPTGLGLMRNYLTVRASDAVIMINGGVGTLNELTILLMERLTPVVVLEGSGGWADRIRTIAYEGRFLDERRNVAIHFADSPQRAVEMALDLGRTRAHQTKSSQETITNDE